MRSLVPRVLLVGISIFAFLISSATQLSDELMFTARLSGDQEVPEVMTDALGVATLSLSSGMDSLSITFTARGLSGEITSAHIHEGAVGENGNVLIDLSASINDNRITAVVSGPMLNDGFLAGLFAGRQYINIHTASNPSGEIRGQFFLETDYAFHADLNAGNENPPVDSQGEGIGYFNLSKDFGSMEVQLTASDLSGPITGAHLHIGSAEDNGPVSVNLGEIIQSTDLHGIVSIEDDSAFIENLMTGNVYINLHTEMFPNGEIRSQLQLDNRISFDAALDVEQVVITPSGTSATATALISVNTTMDTLFYNVQAQGLSSPLSSARIHFGEVGIEGFSVLNISSSIEDNRVQGFTTNSAFIIGFRSLLLSGGLYLSLSTDNNFSGEVRGQVNRVAREGYSFVIDGGQEVPLVSTAARGSGMVSINRTGTSAHYMMVVNELSGPISGAHFQNAPAGDNGPVIFELTNAFEGGTQNEAAFGYWNSDDLNPFDAQSEGFFCEDEVYVNLRTVAHPNGEVRGQVLRGAQQFSTVVYDNGILPQDPQLSPELIWSVELNGNNEVPAVTTDAKGSAGVYLNETRDTLFYQATFDGLSGPITGVHFHQGLIGENGGVEFDLMENLIENRLVGFLIDFDLELFMNDEIYLNVHTAANPMGEIRGQVSMEKDIVFSAILNGQNQVPPLENVGRGLATFTLSQDESYLDIKAIASQLTGPITAAHLHIAEEGVSGPVILDLTDDIVGNTIFTSVVPSTELVMAMMSGDIYLNIHTADNFSGEIRGQLDLEGDFAFDAVINGAQTLSGIDSPSIGLALLTLSDDQSELSYEVFLDRLSGDIQTAHIHSGGLGEMGDVVVDLSNGLDENLISGSTTVGLSDEAIAAMVAGETYINIHTAAYPLGEARGQVFRTARDGFIVDLCSEQQVPALTTNGYGTAVVSTDRKDRNAHVVLTASSLSGPIEQIYVAEGGLGEVESDLLYDLTVYLQSNSVYTYIYLNPENALILDEQEGHLNIRTAANTDGEIRGQIDMTIQCPAFENVSDLLDLSDFGAQLTIYPNPVSGVAYLDYDLGTLDKVDVHVLDMLGNQIEVFALSNQIGQRVIDMSSYESGLYILSFISDKGVGTKSVVKH